jgi:hypothetical protein
LDGILKFGKPLIMKTTLIALAVLISASAFGQCKFHMDMKDAFTGEQVNTIVHDKNGFVWVTVKRGAKFMIEMGFTSVQSTAVFETSDTMRVKLADGTILKLRPITDATPMGSAVSSTSSSGSQSGYYSVKRTSERSTTTTVATSNYNPIFEVERAVYESLSKSPVTVIRFDFGPKPWDFDFTKKPLAKAATAIQANAKCILQVP